MSLYVCLAEYNCRCRPVGRPVNRTTISRHRKEANVKRETYGLPLLPAGPIHTAATSAEQQHRHRDLFRNYSTGCEDTTARQVTLRRSVVLQIPQYGHILCLIGDSSPPAEHISERIRVVRTDPVTNLAAPTGTAVDGIDNFQKQATGKCNSSSEDPLWAALDTTSQTFGGAMETGTPLVERKDMGLITGSKKPSLPFPGKPQPCPLPSDIDEITDYSLNAEFRPSRMRLFYEWIKTEHQWIELAIDFGMTTNQLRRILCIKEAPYKVWKTIERNLQKYGQLHIHNFFSCRGHMLFRFQPPDSGDENTERPPCTTCVSLKTDEDITIHSSICLTARMRKWFLSGDSCDLLYSYRHKNIERDSGDRSEASETKTYYHDFFDGTRYQEIVTERGGEEAAKWDIFISITSDGFQCFNNSAYDVWPILAMVENLPPEVRFLMRNAVPLAYVKGPKEATQLDTFMIPIIEEIRGINADGGTSFEFWDGAVRSVQVHVLYMKGDSPATAKNAGTTGTNGKCPCRFCSIIGWRAQECNHEYYPSVIKILEPSGGGGRRWRLKRLFNPESLPMRRRSDVERIWNELDKPSISAAKRRRISTETGIKRRTVVFDIPSVVAYDSFPIDIMHITLNVVKDMLQLWKGDHPCCVDGNKERYPFVISKESWTRIDEELLALGIGTSESVCGSKPRDSRSYSNWKAHECRRFIAFFAPILLDGHIPKRFMSGIATLSSLIDMCFWPSFSEADVERIHELALSFFRHFEKDYYENDPRRIRLCKSQMHYLLHVADNIRRCGPPVNYSQFFMERFNGYIKQKFNATTCAAESLLEITKRSESWKLVSGRHFVREHFGVEQNRLSPEEAISTVNRLQDAEPLYLKRFSNLSAQYWRQLKLRDLLSEFLMRQNQNFTREEAENCIQNEDFLLHGRVRTGCGVGMYEIGTSSICRSNKTRCDYLIAAEFKGKDEDLRIYYGKVEFFLRYEFQLPSGPVSMDLMLANWVQGLSKNALGQVYVKKRKAPLFEGRTIENVNTISHGVGAVEHYCPRRKEKSIFFIDPQTRIQALLHRGRQSPDGFDRVLADVL